MGKTKIGLIKHTFFNHTLKEEEGFSFKDDDFNLEQLRSEFASFYQLFLSNKKNWSKNIEIVLYVDYLCDLMLCYYQYDYVGSELHNLLKQKKEIVTFIQETILKEDQESINRFPVFLLERLNTNLKIHKSSLASISKLAKEIGKLNTNRSRFTYSRALATQTIVYLQKSPISDLIHEFNELLGNQYSFAEGLNLLNESREALAVLGITLYALRFLINFIIMLKHTIQAAMNKELSANKVLKQELEQRGFTMASDLVWGMVNLLTSYNSFFHISATVVSPLILAFLVFDALLLLAQWFFEATKYNERMQELMVQKNDATALEQAVIQRQIDILNDEWSAQCTYYTINILGANILAVSFAVSMICTGPLALVCLAFLSLLGNSLYNASEEYKKYQQSKIALQRELSNGKISNDEHHQQLINVLNGECNQKYAEFWKTLAFNVGGISFIIIAAVASWPVALGLAVAYMAYQLHSAYQRQQSKNKTEPVTHDIYRIFDMEQAEEPVLTLSC